MTQNSLSPVVKSRISSSSGRTIKVENLSLARIGIMSSFEYFTTRAAASVAASAGEPWKATALKTPMATVKEKTNCQFLRLRSFIDLLLYNVVCFWEFVLRPVRERANHLAAKRKAVVN